MVSRKTQMAWMAGGGVLCLLTIVISCKVREGNPCCAEDDKSPRPVTLVPLPGPDLKEVLKPVPDTIVPTTVELPPIAAEEKKPGPIVPVAFQAEDVPPPAAVPPVTPPTPPIEKVDATAPLPPVMVPVIPPSPPSPPTTKGSEKAFRIDTRAPDATPPTVTGTPLPTLTPPPPAVTPSAPPSIAAPKSEVSVPLPSATPQSAPPAPPTVSVGSEPGEPPLAPKPGPVVNYQVRQGGETFQEIARRTLNTAERWVELVRLNPTLPQDGRLSTGTMVRLPADACIPTEELEVVKPLPGVKPVRPEPARPKALLPLTGTYPCNLDDKGTLLLPKSIRDQLGGVDTLMISPGTDQCLWLTTPGHLERLAQRLEKSEAREVDVHAFKRLYYAQTEKATMTSEGRVMVSDRLAQFAGLHQEVVLVGIDDHFELWDVARWKDFTQKKSASSRANIVAEQE